MSDLQRAFYQWHMQPPHLLEPQGEAGPVKQGGKHRVHIVLDDLQTNPKCIL